MRLANRAFQRAQTRWRETVLIRHPPKGRRYGGAQAHCNCHLTPQEKHQLNCSNDCIERVTDNRSFPQHTRIFPVYFKDWLKNLAYTTTLYH